MSVVNAWRNGRTGYLLTDTAHLDATSGKVAAFGSKAFVCAERFPAALGITMSGGTLDMMIEPFVAAPPKNLKALWRMLPDALRHFQARAKEHDSPNAYARAVAVAWCVRSRSIRIYHCATMPEFGPPMHSRELSYFIGSGAGTPEVDAAIGKLAAGLPLDPDSEALEVMEAQRRKPFDAEDARLAGLHCIGGAIERLTVTSQGVELGTVRQWPDKVGEVITCS